MNKSLKLAGVFLAAIILTGCVFLRYEYERAIKSLPPDSGVTHITNDYIEYTNSQFTVLRAYYTADGTIYKTIQYKK